MTEPLVRPLRRTDREAWAALWEGYNAFYLRTVPAEATAATWDRFFDEAEPVHALVAEAAGAVVGLAHLVLHRSTSTVQPVCYLQDLFTAPQARGRGVGRRLIEAVCERAGQAGATRVTWLTHETNTAAQALYDRVAERSGFIQYRRDLPANGG